MKTMASSDGTLARTFGAITVRLVHDSIAARRVDALVSAANDRLVMGGGVAATLRSRGAIEIHQEAIAHAPAPLGSVVRTGAGKLDARYVYHAVVIDYDVSKGTSAGDVVAAVRGVLAQAEADGVNSLALPLFGAGVGGLKVEQSLDSILDTIESTSGTYDRPLEIEVVVREDDEFGVASRVFPDDKDSASRSKDEDRLAEEFIEELQRKR